MVGPLGEDGGRGGGGIEVRGIYTAKHIHAHENTRARAYTHTGCM